MADTNCCCGCQYSTPPWWVTLSHYANYSPPQMNVPPPQFGGQVNIPPPPQFGGQINIPPPSQIGGQVNIPPPPVYTPPSPPHGNIPLPPLFNPGGVFTNPLPGIIGGALGSIGGAASNIIQGLDQKGAAVVKGIGQLLTGLG